MSAETVSFGGTAIGDMLNSNGGQYVSGTASFTQVSSGGDEFVYSGGTTVSTTVSSSGTATPVLRRHGQRHGVGQRRLTWSCCPARRRPAR